jgi:ankyrin repeat protein
LRCWQMNSTIRLAISILVLLTYTANCSAQETKSPPTSASDKSFPSDTEDEPFCPPKELRGSFCIEGDPDHPVFDGCTKLMAAAERGQLDRVRELLASGAEVDARIAANITALALAAGRGHYEVVKVLLKAGANPNIIGGTFHGGPFAIWMFALNRCNKDWLEIFQAMLDAGVGINPQMGIYLSPLGDAIHDDDAVMVKAILMKGADVNLTDPETGETPLMFAARYSTARVVQVLLKSGAEINARDRKGKTALTFASENLDSRDIIELLKRHGAKQ